MTYTYICISWRITDRSSDVTHLSAARIKYSNNPSVLTSRRYPSRRCVVPAASYSCVSTRRQAAPRPEKASNERTAVPRAAGSYRPRCLGQTHAAKVIRISGIQYDFSTGSRAPFQYKDRLSRYEILMFKIIWSWDRLMYNMGIPVLLRRYLYSGTGPRYLGYGKVTIFHSIPLDAIPESKVHGANMEPTWVLSAPDGPHVGPMNLAIRDY